MCHCLKHVQCLDVDSFWFSFTTDFMLIDSNTYNQGISSPKITESFVCDLNPCGIELCCFVQVLRYFVLFSIYPSSKKKSISESIMKIIMGCWTLFLERQIWVLIFTLIVVSTTSNIPLTPLYWHGGGNVRGEYLKTWTNTTKSICMSSYHWIPNVFCCLEELIP